MSTSATSRFRYDDVKLKPEEQISLHSHSDWELSYVLTGSGIRLIGDTESKFAAGDLVLIPPYIPHCWYFDKTVTDGKGNIANITVLFNTEFLDCCATTFIDLAERIEILKRKQQAISFDNKRHDVIARYLKQMQGKDPIEQSVMSLRLLAAITEQGNDTVEGHRCHIDRKTKRLNQIRIYTSCNLDKRITIEDLARHIGMNRSALCSFFRHATGDTYVSYLNKLRIEKVCENLSETDSQISDIAYECGFNSIPYFNRIFKNITGLSPQQYRIIHQKL